MPERVIIFIDAQNFYHGARRAFFNPEFDPHTCGQFNPLELGRLICSRRPTESVLEQVRVYTGRPSSTRDPRSYGAHMKQCARWQATGVHVVPRALRYPRQWPRQRAEEKAIDVALAIDFVALALDGAYEVGVLASTDTDLKPPMELVLDRNLAIVEVACWRGAYVNQPLRLPGRRLRCHWLDEIDYRRVEDGFNYAL